MPTMLSYWLLTLLPSLPLVCIYVAFRKVLVSKKFEMQMLLERGESLTKYLSAYGSQHSKKTVPPTEGDKKKELAKTIADQIFRVHYSHAEYCTAIAFNIVTTSILMVAALSLADITLGLPAGLQAALAHNPYVRDAVAGGVGALVWSILELAERYRSGGLAPDTLFTLGARLIVASTVGAVIGAFANEKFGWPLAFGIGVLPTQTIRAYFANETLKTLKISAVPAIEEKPPLSYLQGWSPEVRDKLIHAGISSVQELACTNPFQVFLRSNLEWRVILDLSDQALLLVYIGGAIEKLRPLGIRSAVELAVIQWDEDEGNDGAFGMSLDETLARIATALNMDEPATKLLIHSVADDITVALLSELWSDDTPSSDEDNEDNSEAGTPQIDEGGEEAPLLS